VSGIEGAEVIKSRSSLLGKSSEANDKTRNGKYEGKNVGIMNRECLMVNGASERERRMVGGANYLATVAFF